MNKELEDWLRFQEEINEHDLERYFVEPIQQTKKENIYQKIKRLAILFLPLIGYSLLITIIILSIKKFLL